jgi:hypothetical protein
MTYCIYCGSEMEIEKINRYDENTGEQRTNLFCPNTNCKEGCEHDGHEWGNPLKLQNPDKCRRCGYVICDML